MSFKPLVSLASFRGSIFLEVGSDFPAQVDDSSESTRETRLVVAFF